MSCEHHKVAIQISGTISSWSLSSCTVYWTICSGFIQPMFLSCTSSNCNFHNTRRLGFLWRWICFLVHIQRVVLNYTPLGVCHLHLVGRHEYIFISISELNDIALDRQTQCSMMQVYGRYNDLDQAVCKICNVVVKSEVLWNPHLASRAHKEVIFLNCFNTSYPPPLVLTQDIQEPIFI